MKQTTADGYRDLLGRLPESEAKVVAYFAAHPWATRDELDRAVGQTASRRIARLVRIGELQEGPARRSAHSRSKGTTYALRGEPLPGAKPTPRRPDVNQGTPRKSPPIASDAAHEIDDGPTCRFCGHDTKQDVASFIAWGWRMCVGCWRRTEREAAA